MEVNLADDLMIGAKPIAAFLGLPVRPVFYMMENGQLPAFKIGSKWAARKSTLAGHIVQLESAGKTKTV